LSRSYCPLVRGWHRCRQSPHNGPVAAHSISIVPPAVDEAATADTLELHCAADGPPLRIAAESGRTWHILAVNAAACTRLVHEALRSSAVERVPGSGGLLSATSVLENIVLPAVYHGRIAGPRLAAAVYEVFAACAMDREQADALCERPVSDLDSFEQRLICLLRALLMQPGVLLCERIFEGLSPSDMERVAQFSAYYRRVVAKGSVVFLDITGMARPGTVADVRVEATH